MKIERWGLLVLMLSCLSAFAEPALTEKQKKLKAREVYEAGERAFRVGDVKIAAERFKESYQLYPTPLILFNLGQVHKQMGELEKAAFFFKQYLAASEAENRFREDAQRRLDEIERALEAKKRAAEPTPAPEPTPIPPATVVPAADANLTAHPPEKKPVYKKAWFWGAVVGGVVVVGAAVAVGVVLGTRSSGPTTLDPVSF